MSTSVVMAGELRVPSGAPPGFVDHVHRYGFSTPHPPGRVWAWLNDPATFTEGQIWPFRVEFVDGGFEPGVLNAHHGPFLNLAGAIGEVQGFERGVAHRDLKYFYGSYAISPRLVRPGYSSGPKNRVAERWSSFTRQPRAPLVRADVGPLAAHFLEPVPPVEGLGAREPRRPDVTGKRPALSI